MCVPVFRAFRGHFRQPRLRPAREPCARSGSDHGSVRRPTSRMASARPEDGALSAIVVRVICGLFAMVQDA